MKMSNPVNYCLIFLASTLLSSCSWVEDFASDWNMEENKHAGIEIVGWTGDRAPAPGEDVSSSKINLPEPIELEVPQYVNASYNSSPRRRNIINATPRGLSNKSLFANGSVNTEERLARLEKAVQSMSDDMGRLVPVLSKLGQAESELRAVLNNLSGKKKNILLTPVSVESEPMVSVSPEMIEPASGGYDAFGQVEVTDDTEPMEVAYIMAQIEPVAGYSHSVNRIRFGTHPNKTRIVLDVSNEIEYSTDLDNNEGLLIVDLLDSQWDGVMERSLQNSDIISGYSVQPLDGVQGSRLIIELKKEARIKLSNILPPISDGSRGYRVVLDISGV